MSFVEQADDFLVALVDNGDVDGFKVDLRGVLVGMAQPVTDHADGQFVLSGDGGPGVARPVHRQVPRDTRLRCHRLQQSVHVVLHVAVLATFLPASRMDDG